MNNDMNLYSMNIHDRLRYLANEGDLVEGQEGANKSPAENLVQRVCRSEKSLNSQATQKTSLYCLEILNAHHHELRKSDLPSLRTLKDIVATFPLTYDSLPDDSLPDPTLLLARKINDTIEGLENSDAPLDALSDLLPPPGIVDIVTHYLPVNERIKLGAELTQKDISDMNILGIVSLTQMVQELYEASPKNPQIPHIIYNFFLQANAEKRITFIDCIDQNENLLLLTLASLPPLTEFSCNPTAVNASFTDNCLKTLLTNPNLINLEVLGLFDCCSLTEASLTFIANMPHLRELHLEGCEDTFSDPANLLTLTHNPKMANLRSLHFWSPEPQPSFSLEQQKAIKTSPYIRNLMVYIHAEKNIGAYLFHKERS